MLQTEAYLTIVICYCKIFKVQLTSSKKSKFTILIKNDIFLSQNYNFNLTWKFKMFFAHMSVLVLLLGAIVSGKGSSFYWNASVIGSCKFYIASWQLHG